MTSILEAQIDYLGEQVHSLPAEDRNAGQIEQAMAVSLSLFDQILAAAKRGSAQFSSALFEHWLRSAEMILTSSRELKRAGEPLPLAGPFMRAILRARAFAGSQNGQPTDASWASLDEVERDLQSGAQ
jgi:hypothetical protein